MQLNIGCGMTPTSGWRNFDNSMSLHIARFQAVASILYKLRILTANQFSFIQFASINAIEYGDAVRGLPIQSGSVDAIYSSHMLEHLDRNEASKFLSEAIRMLSEGGFIRLAVPDLRLMIEQYLNDSDADAFVNRTGMAAENSHGQLERLKRALIGERSHLWLYDEKSLTKLLARHGFVDIFVLRAGETHLKSPGALNLFERSEESLYVEARKPVRS